MADIRRIAQLLPALEGGGVESCVVELSRALVKRGVESIVISSGGRYAAQIEVDGGHHIHLPIASKNPLTFLQRGRGLGRVLRQCQPQLLHVHSRMPSWLTAFANRRLALPVVTTVHGINSVNAYSRVMTRGQRLICPSSAVREHLQRHYSVAADRVTVVPCGVDCAHFDPQQVSPARVEALRRALGYGREERVALFAARLSANKGHDLFLRALAEVRRRGSPLRGLIIGSGKERKVRRLRRLSTALGLTDAVRFLGHQSNIREYYALAHVVVLASVKPEAFGGVAIAEAMAMERPVVAPAHGGAPELIEDGNTGLLFPPGDVSALADCLLRADTLPAQGRRAAITSRFTLRAMVEGNLAVYHAVLGRDGGPAMSAERGGQCLGRRAAARLEAPPG